MKLFKILALTLLAISTTIAAEDLPSTAGQRARSIQTSRPGDRPELLGDLKSTVMKITKTLDDENAELRKQLGFRLSPSVNALHLSSFHSFHKTSLQEDSLGTTGADFVHAIFENLRRTVLGIISDLEQENIVLKQLLTEMTQQAEEVVDLEFFDGQKVTYTHRGLSLPRGRYSGNMSMTPTTIQFDGICINRTLSFTEVANQLKSTPGIKSAVLRTIPLSLDDKFERVIKTINDAQTTDLTPQQKIARFRQFCAITKQYQEDGSKLAHENLPTLQSMLGIEFANFSHEQQTHERILLLREAVNLLEISAHSGNEDAGRNAPMANYLLGVSLINAANEEKDIAKSTSFLREGVQFMDKARRMGKIGDEDQFAFAQFLLAQNLFAVVFPPQGQKLLFNSDDISTLREAHDLLMSVKDHNSDAARLFHIVRSILSRAVPGRSATQAVIEGLGPSLRALLSPEDNRAKAVSTVTPLALDKVISRTTGGATDQGVEQSQFILKVQQNQISELSPKSIIDGIRDKKNPHNIRAKLANYVFFSSSYEFPNEFLRECGINDDWIAIVRMQGTGFTRNVLKLLLAIQLLQEESFQHNPVSYDGERFVHSESSIMPSIVPLMVDTTIFAGNRIHLFAALRCVSEFNPVVFPMIFAELLIDTGFDLTTFRQPLADVFFNLRDEIDLEACKRYFLTYFRQVSHDATYVSTFLPQLTAYIPFSTLEEIKDILSYIGDRGTSVETRSCVLSTLLSNNPTFTPRLTNDVLLTINDPALSKPSKGSLAESFIGNAGSEIQQHLPTFVSLFEEPGIESKISEKLKSQAGKATLISAKRFCIAKGLLTNPALNLQNYFYVFEKYVRDRKNEYPLRVYIAAWLLVNKDYKLTMENLPLFKQFAIQPKVARVEAFIFQQLCNYPNQGIAETIKDEARKISIVMPSGAATLDEITNIKRARIPM